MSNFTDGYTDKTIHSGFLDKSEVLSYVSEEDIFELVFGFKPQEYDIACSPFRVDLTPGAYFERSPLSNALYFIDFADTQMTHYDCFSAVQVFFKLPNFYQTLIFIQTHLINGRGLIRRTKVTASVVKVKPRTEIVFQSRAYLMMDKAFWDRYEITKDNLLEDRVMPVSRYRITNPTKDTVTTYDTFTPTFAFTDFHSGNRKLYFPYRKNKSTRFISTCGRDDIGCISSLDYSDQQLIITKSYKDCRVLRNQGYNSVWFQSENTIPSDEILLRLTENFSDIIIFYDNDQAGILGADKLKTKLEEIGKESMVLHLPIFLLEEGIKDPSDLIYKKGRQELLDFLNSNI